MVHCSNVQCMFGVHVREEERCLIPSHTFISRLHYYFLWFPYTAHPLQYHHVKNTCFPLTLCSSQKSPAAINGCKDLPKKDNSHLQSNVKAIKKMLSVFMHMYVTLNSMK